jgi:hypothetical protein
MLRRLPLGFAGVFAAAIVIAACSSPSATQTISVGPNFPSQSLYAANVTQNAVNIYATGSPVPASTSGPLYQISCTAATCASSFPGPQYLAFDSTSNLWVTSWLASTASGGITEFKALATGDVLPFQQLSLGNVRPRGVADFLFTFAGATTGSDILVVAVTDPSQPAAFNSGLQFYDVATALGASYQTIAGPATGLNVPSGVAVDNASPTPHIYAANLQGASVTEYALPAASPTPSPTPTPTATPSPAPTPTGQTASPSPTPAPTATPLNFTPVATISGATTGINQPTGIAIDSSDNIYVSDQHSTVCTPNCPAILIFAKGANGGVAPTRYIAGSNTLLTAPTDVKVDKNGYIYVSDEASGLGVIYVFASTAKGNVAPMATLKSPGAVIGLGLTP